MLENLYGGTPLDFQSQPLSGFLGKPEDRTGTAHTLLLSDSGKILRFTNASAITLTLPPNLPEGFNVMIYQKGTGQITFSPTGSATIASFNALTKTAGQKAAMALVVVENPANTAAVYQLSGEGA